MYVSLLGGYQLHLVCVCQIARIPLIRVQMDFELPRRIHSYEHVVERRRAVSGNPKLDPIAFFTP